MYDLDTIDISTILQSCDHDRFLPTPVPGAFRKRWILERPKNMPPACFLNGLKVNCCEAAREGGLGHSNPATIKNPASTDVVTGFLSRLDTIDVIPRTQIRPPNFCKKQIFRSQVSTDTWICFTGSTFFKVFHTILRFSGNYGESSQNARFISLCCLFHSQASLSEYIDMMHERPFLF